jgi:hypothetical protein
MIDTRDSPTVIGAIGMAALSGAEVPLTPSNDDSFALSLYRHDPVDRQPYVVACRGLREPESIIVPTMWDQLRTIFDFRSKKSHALSFRSREGLEWAEGVACGDWHLLVCGRRNTPRRGIAAVKSRILSTLAAVPEAHAVARAPLFEDLWNKDRLCTDAILRALHDLPARPSLEQAAKALVVALSDTLAPWLAPPAFNIGIYLNAGGKRKLCESEPIDPWRPESIPRISVIDPDRVNPLDFVAATRRGLLIGRQHSGAWRRRLRAAADDYSTMVRASEFSGLCVVPLHQGPEQIPCMGMLVLTAHGPALAPMHVFLLNRAAALISSHLALLFQYPNFRYWPDAKIQRGGALIEECTLTGDVRTPVPVLTSVVSQLMPSHSRVRIAPLRAGQSGSEVFELHVSDECRIAEVTRVLKIGAPELIEDELWRYLRYADHKRVGGAARVEIARVWCDAERPGGSNRTGLYGAIVYMLVGGGEPAVAWSKLVERGGASALIPALELLREQLSCWYTRSRQADRSVVELYLSPLVSGGFRNHLNRSIATIPSFADVKRLLTSVCVMDHPQLRENCKTCIVHGDLHSDNIFAVLAPDDTVRSVALIDWGSVRSGRHPLSDISKLMTDLAYRVQCTPEMRDLAFDVLRGWGVCLGCDPEDWRIALIHQIAKIMFYRYGVDESKPFIGDVERRAAWDDLRRLVNDLSLGCRPAA